MNIKEKMDLIKKQSQRLFDLVECGYDEAVAKLIGNIPLSEKEIKIIENYKNETKELLGLINKPHD